VLHEERRRAFALFGLLAERNPLIPAAVIVCTAIAVELLLADALPTTFLILAVGVLCVVTTAARTLRHPFGVQQPSRSGPGAEAGRLDAYRQALEEHFCITVTDATGRILEANKRFCELTGYAPADLVGQSYDILSSGRQSIEFLEDMWAAVHAGKTWRGEFCDRAKGGSDIWLESIVIPRFDAAGAIDHFVTISTDITEIRGQAITLEAMIDNFPGGIALVDRDLRLVACNKLYRTLLDLPDILFVGGATPVTDILRYRAEKGHYGPGDIEDLVRARVDRFLGSSYEVDERTEINGKTLEVRTVPIPGGGYLKTYVDITDRRKAEAELRRAHCRLEAFVKHAPAAVAMFDTDMRYVAHSDRWLNDYNLSEKSLVGRHHYDVFPEIPPHWRAKHRRIMAGATESSPEERFLRADGSVNIIRWEVRPWYLEDQTIGGIMMLTEEITERKKLEDQLWRLAKLDSLTGLPNRLQFNEKLNELIESATADGSQFAVGLIDLDRFKEINDILGHDAGDDLLKEVAARLDEALRPYGSVARLGGDEFAILISAGSAISLLSRPIEAVFAAMERPVILGGAPRRCTISLGLTIFPSDATKPTDLLKNADLALYRAKELGRDRYELFVGEMRTSIENSYQLHHDVQHALASDAFCLLYQPIVSPSGSQRVSFEALLRWNHPTRGLLAPGDFEEVFDDPKVAAEIGRRVIDRAIRQAAAWESSGLEFGRIAVNVTSADFALGGFAEYVDTKLREHGVGAERLSIEVTERVFLGRSAFGVTEALDKLHDTGIEIALDDFGTGFASLSHIKKFPIDRLKVDRSFVRDMETNPDNLAIVRTIIQLGTSLGIHVTAEGVETKHQLTLLRSMGCDCIQGYLYSKPLDPAAIPAFVAREPGRDTLVA